MKETKEKKKPATAPVEDGIGAAAREAVNAAAKRIFFAEAQGKDTDAPEPAAALPVGKKEIEAASEELERYRAARAELDARIEDNRDYWRMTRRGRTASGDPETVTGWLFSSVVNKHADAMDSIPEPCVLPREADDEAEAAALSSVLPVILDNCGFEGLYSDLWWSKLIDGSAVTGVFWDPKSGGRRGDVALTRIDPLNIYWEPGIRDIQDSHSVFTLERVLTPKLIGDFPHLEGILGPGAGKDGGAGSPDGYSTVVDWYYKKNGALHFCRFTEGELLYASENDPLMKGGWYSHGQYPFVVDPMYPDSGGLLGFGAVDVAKNAQRTIDRLDSVITKNALINSRPRYFVRIDGGVCEEEFADTSNEIVHVASSALGEDSIRQIAPAPLGQIYADILRMKVEELKETAGNRDFSQGATNSGVTSGVAIAALQEAGSKLSRDVIKGTYRALSRICVLVIDLIRQFYTSPRSFRVKEGGRRIDYDNGGLCPVRCGHGTRTPLFDVRIEQCKASPFSREVANERAMQLWQNGFFLPENREMALAALEIMDFEGKEKLLSRLGAAGENDEKGVPPENMPGKGARALAGAALRYDGARKKLTGRK